MSLADQERIVLGTLLAEFPEKFPTPIIDALLRHAPASFEDPRHGEIAVAIRELWLSRRAVHTLSLCDFLLERGRMERAGGFLFATGFDKFAMSPFIMGCEAEPVWEAYQSRQLLSVLAEAHGAVSTHPAKAPAIRQMVLRSLDEVESSSRVEKFTIRRPDEILAMTFDDSDRIIGDRLVAESQPLVIAGPGGIGKSRLLLQAAVSCLAGRPFIGLETRGPERRWLILQAENSNRRLNQDLARLREWAGDQWPAVNERLLIHTLETDVDGFLTLDNPDTVKRIAEVIEAHRPDLVAFDSLYNLAGGDLNADTDMRDVLTTIMRLARQGNPRRAVVVLHHSLTGKGGAARATGYERASFGRNSKVLHSWTRAQINLAPGSPDDPALLVVACGKCSNGREFAPFAIRLDPQSMVYAVDPEFDLKAWEVEVGGRRESADLMTPDRVRELCRAPMSKAELSKAIIDDCGCVRGSSYRHILRAEKARAIKFNRDRETYARH
jgi:hypothetical protein